MEKLIKGLHHITAISGDVQGNIDFYTGILGLRLVKRTVNFDNSEVYHFYFGNENGTPGTIFTTFPYGKGLVKGRHGNGMLNTTAFSVDIEALDYWMKRLEQFNVRHKNPQERFGGEAVIYLEDDDGLGLELVFTANDPRDGYDNGVIPEQYAIKGIYNVEIWLESYERMAGLLVNDMDHTLIRESSNRFRFGVEDQPGKYVDLLCSPNAIKSLPGRGTVHHVAFEVPDADAQLKMMQRIEALGVKHTGIKDWKYFTSVYFREPNGVLFEIATSGPGFDVDEELGTLGNSLRLPEQFEDQRTSLDRHLAKFNYTPEKFK